MLLTFDDFDSRLPSGRLWRGFAPPASMGPHGTYWTTPSGNPAFGFFDNFHSFQTNTGDGPYLILEGSNASVEQIADTDTEKGLVQLATTGAGSGGANEEAGLQWGRGLGAPFKLADKDLVFEARFTQTVTTAAKFSVGVGLGEVGMGATDAMFADSTGALADKNFLGFVSLLAESTAWDGAYKADGQTYQDGATKTKLNALGTMVAATYLKVGFRYRAHPKRLEWYVDNALPGGTITPARLTTAEIDAATFPDDVLLAPILVLKDVAGDTNGAIKLDWWGAAQLL